MEAKCIARCIGKCLLYRGVLYSECPSSEVPLYTCMQVSTRSEAHSELNSFRRKSESALIITGSSLELCIKHYEQVGNGTPGSLTNNFPARVPTSGSSIYNDIVLCMSVHI